jgi:hypothetical protein
VVDLFQSAKGKYVDAGFIRQVRDAFAGACAGQKPALQHGFTALAVNPCWSGPMLIVSPSERFSSKTNLDRPWRLYLRSVFRLVEAPATVEIPLFDPSADPKGDAALEAAFKRINSPEQESWKMTFEIAPIPSAATVIHDSTFAKSAQELPLQICIAG